MAAVLTTVGKTWVVQKLNEGVQSTGSAMHWGTSSASAAVADTALSASASESRIISSVATATDTITWTGTLTANGTKVIGEVGMFDQTATAGTLFIHGNFTLISLNSGDTIAFTVSLQFT